MEIFSERLRERARELKLSDAEVARRAGLQEARYNHYVTGRREPDLQTMVRICRVLNCTPNDLLGFGAEDKKAQSKSRSESLRERIAAASALLDEEQLKIALKQIEAFVKR